MSATRRTAAQARWETTLLMRNGEQLLLTIIIPIAILLVLAETDIVATYTGPDRLPSALATVLTVSVVSGAFTSLAIATAFERRSGALRFLGTTPLTRTELLLGKLLATAAVTGLSAVVVTALALVLGWRPTVGSAWVILELFAGAAAFASWGIALAGLLRAEAVLAVANGIFLVLLMFGGIIVPPSALPSVVGTIATWLPSGALSEMLTDTLVSGSAPSWAGLLTLAVWFVVGAVVASRTFRWS